MIIPVYNLGGLYEMMLSLFRWMPSYLRKYWAAAPQNQQNDLCAQRRLKSVWASAQSDQSLHCALNGKLRTYGFFMRRAKTLIRLRADAEADLSLRWAHKSFCWFWRAQAQISLLNPLHMDRVKRIWYLSPMRAAKVQASLRIRAVSPEPPLLAHISSESRGTFRQKARSLASVNGWACAVKTCRDGMLEDTNSLDGAHMVEFW